MGKFEFTERQPSYLCWCFYLVFVPNWRIIPPSSCDSIVLTYRTHMHSLGTDQTRRPNKLYYFKCCLEAMYLIYLVMYTYVHTSWSIFGIFFEMPMYVHFQQHLCSSKMITYLHTYTLKLCRYTRKSSKIPFIIIIITTYSLFHQCTPR